MKKTIQFILTNFILIIIIYTISSLLNIRIRYFITLYMFFPMITVFIISFINHSELISKWMFLNGLNKWYIIAWFLPLIISIASILVSLLFPSVHFSPYMDGLKRFGIELKKNIKDISPYIPIINQVGKGLIFGIFPNSVFAIGEEIGWRGFLWNEIKNWGFWKSSLFIGLLWGIWHIPLVLDGYNYSSNTGIGSFMMIIFCILLTPVMNLIREKTNSVIGPAVFHGSLNAFANLPLIFTTGLNEIYVGIYGIAGFSILAIINFILFFYLKFSNKKTLIPHTFLCSMGGTILILLKAII